MQLASFEFSDLLKFREDGISPRVKLWTSPTATVLSVLTGDSPDEQLLEEFGHYSVKSVSISEASLRVQLVIMKSIETGILTVTFPNNGSLQKLGDDSVSLLGRTLHVAPVDMLVTGLDPVLEAAKAPVGAAVTSLTTLMMVASVPQAFVLMKVFQTVDFYIFIDCDYPPNFSLFLELISKNVLDLLPNPLEQLADDSGKPVQPRFEKFGMKIHVFSNIGVQLSLLLGFCFLKLVVDFFCQKRSQWLCRSRGG
jgi:hypothetical protein